MSTRTSLRRVVVAISGAYALLIAVIVLPPISIGVIAHDQMFEILAWLSAGERRTGSTRSSRTPVAG